MRALHHVVVPRLLHRLMARVQLVRSAVPMFRTLNTRRTQSARGKADKGRDNKDNKDNARRSIEVHNVLVSVQVVAPNHHSNLNAHRKRQMLPHNALPNRQTCLHNAPHVLRPPTETLLQQQQVQMAPVELLALSTHKGRTRLLAEQLAEVGPAHPTGEMLAVQVRDQDNVLAHLVLRRNVHRSGVRQ